MEFTVIVEIPAYSKVKYEIDHTTNKIWVDRILNTSNVYPLNYGYIENTLGLDGDPLDALLLLDGDIALYPMSYVYCRAVGVLYMEDESGIDSKILAIPIKGMYQVNKIQNIDDIDQYTLNKVKHFFEVYKNLEAGKYVKDLQWKECKDAENIILDSQLRYKKI